MELNTTTSEAHKVGLYTNVANWPSTLMVVFLTLSVGSYFFEEKIVFDLISAFVGGVILVLQSKFIQRRYLKLLILFLFASSFSFFITYVFQERPSTVPLRLFVQFSILVLLLRYTIKPKFILVCLYTYVTVVLFLFFVNKVRLNDVFPAASENIVGWMALAMGVFYYIISYRNGDKIKVLPSLVVMGFAIFCVGRGTIAASLIFTFGVLFFRYYYRNIRAKVILGILAIGSLVFLVQYGAVVDLFLAGFRKFNDKGLSLDHRDYIMEAYFDKLNFSTFFMGVTPDQSPFIQYNSNFHNSYLLAHSQFGIFGILVLILMIIALFKSLRNHFFLGTMLLAISLRIFTDVIAFVGIFDFVIFYCLYLLLSKRSNLSNYYS